MKTLSYCKGPAAGARHTRHGRVPTHAPLSTYRFQRLYKLRARHSQVLEPLLDDVPLDTAAVLRLHIATATCLNDLHTLLHTKAYAASLDYTHVCSLVSAISRTLDGCFIGQHERAAVSLMMAQLHQLVRSNLSRFCASDIVALLEGYAQLQTVDTHLVVDDANLISSLAMKACAGFPMFSGPQMARALWALLQLSHTPSAEWKEQFFERSYYKLSELQAPDHAVLLQALEAAQWVPPTRWIKAWMFHAEVTHGFRASEMGVILRALAILEIPLKRNWCTIMVEKIQRDLMALEPQQLADLLWACANITGESHPFCPSSRWMEDYLDVSLNVVLTRPAISRLQAMPGLLKPVPNLFVPTPPPSALHSPPPSPSHSYTHFTSTPAYYSSPAVNPYSSNMETLTSLDSLDSLSSIDSFPASPDMLSLSDTFSSTIPPPSSLASCGPSTPSPWFASPYPPAPTTAHQLSRIISSLAQLAYRPSHYWLAEFVLEVGYKLPAFEAEDLALLMWGLAMLEHRPDNDWLKQFGAEVQSKMDSMTPSQMSRIMWALSVFHYHIA